MQPLLEVGGKFGGRAFVFEEDRGDVGLQGGLRGFGGIGGVPLPNRDADAIAPFHALDSMGLRERPVIIVSGRDGHFGLCQRIVLQILDTHNHFVVIARAQGFADVFFHVASLGAVKAGQPIGLVSEYACQREDDQQGDVFQGQFHALVLF